MKKDFGQTKSPLWLMINAITIPNLVRRVFEKSAKAYKVDWGNIPETSHDEFTDKVYGELLNIKDKHPSCYLELYSSLRCIQVASTTPRIMKLMRGFTEINSSKVKSMFYADEFRMIGFGNTGLHHCANMAAWFCVMDEKGLDAEWRKIVDFVNDETAERVSWQFFNISSPQNIEEEDIEKGIELFKAKFGAAMETNKGMDFPVEVHTFPSTGKYVRYEVKVPKDPTKAYLVDQRSVIVAFDPTMHKFFIDHYFAENKIRVSWPVMCDERVAAEYFVEHVLGAEIIDEVVKYYTKPLRKFTSSVESRKLLQLNDEDKDSIASIRIMVVDFTYAESEDEAEKARRQRENKKRGKCGEELRPAFKCYNYKGTDIWKYLDEHFDPTRYKPEWRDVLSITFSVELYALVVKSHYRFYDHNKKRKFKIICKPNKLDYSPKMHEIVEPEYKATLRYIAEKKLNFVGQLLGEQTEDEHQEGTDGSSL